MRIWVVPAGAVIREADQLDSGHGSSNPSLPVCQHLPRSILIPNHTSLLSTRTFLLRVKSHDTSPQASELRFREESHGQWRVKGRWGI